MSCHSWKEWSLSFYHWLVLAILFKIWLKLDKDLPYKSLSAQVSAKSWQWTFFPSNCRARKVCREIFELSAIDLKTELSSRTLVRNFSHLMFIIWKWESSLNLLSWMPQHPEYEQFHLKAAVKAKWNNYSPEMHLSACRKDQVPKF